MSGGGVVLAAGAVTWRDGPDGPEVALVHRPRYDDWSIPKGKLDPGEHVLAAAAREVREETGSRVALGPPLGSASYEVLGRPKVVHWWAGEALGGDFAPGEEVDELRWLAPDAALPLLARDSERDVLERAAALPRPTGAVVLLRHAKAVSRKAWDGVDAERPLHADGGPQAEALAPLLRAWAPDAVISSPARRCLDTVAPFDAGVEQLAQLSEEGYRAEPDTGGALVDALVQDGRRTVVCTHRPVLPGLLDVLCGRAADAGVAAALDLAADPLRPAELVVAHTAAGRVVAVERHRP